MQRRNFFRSKNLVAPQELCFSACAFSNMKRLWLFIAHKADHSGDPICFTNELRWLEWPEYNSSLPFGSSPKELAGLCMARRGIQLLGEELRVLYFLYRSHFGFCLSF